MEKRIKMRREDRAKQFAPFDALKGLQEALRMKEYEHDKKLKGELPEEKIIEISNIILSLRKNTKIEVEYFFDGYTRKISGSAIVDIPFQKLEIDKFIIPFDDIQNITLL